MNPKICARLFAVALLCCLSSGCHSGFHVVLFNSTNDTIIIRRRAQDPTPLVVLAGISGNITGVSTDDFTIEREGRLLHYRFPEAYTYPSAAVPAGYERRVPSVGRAFYFHLAPDNRIYILRAHDSLHDISHAQPAGFPLVPR